MSENPICITFAGAPGSSKTPITNYLSGILKLPIHNNDAIRTEVLEDLGVLDETEFKNRRNERIQAIITNKTSIIFDASVDREWAAIRKALTGAGYTWFIISMDLSKELLVKLYETKGYTAIANIDDWLEDHEKFLKEYSSDVSLHITDSDFPERLDISLKTAQNWLTQKM